MTTFEISIHALREEGDFIRAHHYSGKVVFLSTPSARRATDPVADSNILRIDFYPRPPRGGRRAVLRGQGNDHRISIHALREEGDTSASGARSSRSYFYPRPPRGGRPLCFHKSRLRSLISIHALREEGDKCVEINGVFK